MKALFFRKGLLILVGLWFVWVCPLHAQTPSDLRLIQPVVLTGAQVPELAGAPVGEISLWAFDAATGSWKALPFQIDERGPSGSYFSTDNGVLDANDELVFMVSDFGDAASDTNWIPDTASRNYPRYEIVVTDPQNPESHVYGYLYRVIPPAVPPPVPPLVSIDPKTQEIYSDHYRIGFGQNGLPNKIVVPVSAGGNGRDFLDRLKIHIVAEVKGFSGPTQIQITENSIHKQGIKFKVGPVRIIRSIIFKIVVDLGALGQIESPDTYYFPIFFYPYSMAVQADSIDLSLTNQLSIKILSVRYSLDLNPNASGMKFYNPNNSGILIDGQPDPVNKNIQPGLNYQMVTGTPGTLVSLIEVPDIGSQQQLYYCESTTGSTCDGTWDTGDSLSYGDAGFRVTGTNIQGVLRFWSTLYMLPGNQPADTGAKLLDDTQNPFTLSLSLQNSRVSVTENGTWSTAPVTFQVHAAYPNPFRANVPGAQTYFSYVLPRQAAVSITVFDITGRIVRKMNLPLQLPGSHAVSWNGTDASGALLPAGIYFYRIQAGRSYATKKLLLIR
ncbi:MAG: T9SS type A sorting domain-containing protein [Calditrichaeota bacterium]|nr:T9SS type A sorting domain-containing protein [Calditrichota bacterium]